MHTTQDIPSPRPLRRRRWGAVVARTSAAVVDSRIRPAVRTAAVVRIPAAAAAEGDSSLLLPVAGPVVAGTIVGDTVVLRRNLCSTCLHRGKRLLQQKRQAVEGLVLWTMADGWMVAFEWSEVAVLDSNICFDHGESIR